MNKCLLFFSFFCAWGLQGQNDFKEVKITSEKLADDIYILYGAGGNIGLAVGKDEAYVIDDQFGPLTDKILAHVKKLTQVPVKFVLNTHWHGDHTGGNANLAKQGALVFAHDNVRKRMLEKDATKPEALPIVTFNDKMTLFLDNGSSMHAIHVESAHTDGDSYYYFPQENVIHMGDNFFNGRYPYIDINSGGDIDGLLRNLKFALTIVNDATKIIPGHGMLASKKDLQDYFEVLHELRKRVVQARQEGHSLKETQEMGLSKEWDATHGKNFINPDQIIEFIYKSAD